MTDRRADRSRTTDIASRAARRPVVGRQPGRVARRPARSPSSSRRSTSTRTRTPHAGLARRPGRRPGARHRRAPRRQPGVVARRPLLAFTSRRGEKEQRGDAARPARRRPGRGAHGRDDARRHRRPRRGRPTASGSRFTSRTRDARYEAKDERWQSPRKIETFFTRLDNEGWIFDRPQHVYVVARRRHRRRRATSRPARSSTTASSGSPTRPASSPSAQRHDGWDRDLAEDLYVVPLDGEIRAAHQADRHLRPPVGLARRHRRSPSSASTTRARTRRTPRSASSPSTGGAHRWISDGLDRTFAPTAGARPPVWLDDDTLLATAEDRGDTHLYRLAADGSAPPEPLTARPR